MRKNISILLIALMMITVLFIYVSCKEEPAQPEPESTVTLTFDTQGGVKMSPITVNPGEKIKKSKVKTPSREGYQFLGWFSDTNWKTEVTFPLTLNESMTIYAKWINQTTYEHSDPILPKGSVALNNNSFTIPLEWSADPAGKTGLPAVTYSFSGERTSETNVSEALVNAVKNTPQEFFAETPKNIIFLFSDGWGVTEVNMSREYKGDLIMDSLPYATESKTDSYYKYKYDNSVSSDYSNHTTTDSCAGGTQVLAGYKTRYGYIALDVDGNEIETLIEAAHRMNWKTGNVTNDNIVDATPAAAMIHDANRYHSDVLYYKALQYALVQQDLDLLMGWDWGMSRYFNNQTWEERLLAAEKEGIKDAISEYDLDKQGVSFDGGNPITFFTGLATTEIKATVAGFSVYYHLWEHETGKTNSNLKWTSTGAADLSQYTTWLTGAGLTNAIAKLQTALPDPSTAVNRFTTFKSTVENSDTTFSKPVLGSWTNDGNNYESASPNRGYLLNGSIGTNYPSWPEMVAYTIYQLDKEADAADTGFFCIIENTCTDGWGHAQKGIEMMNEVQCFDEGVAIAIKYVLEHPDTLLVISADHETGGFKLRDGWETDITKISSTTSGHSSQRVPLYAFGAGADNFSAEKIAAKYASVPQAGLEEGGKIHEGWITGAIMGELMTGEAFGETAGYAGHVFDVGKADDPYGNPLWDPADPVWTPTAE